MDSSGPSLTQLLLDLTEDAELSEAFANDPDSIIDDRGLGQYADLLKSGDLQALREAVRAELGVPPRPTPGVRDTDCVIAGVRIPPGVREPPDDQPIEGVQEPPPEEGAIPGVQEPGPPQSI